MRTVGIDPGVNPRTSRRASNVVSCPVLIDKILESAGPVPFRTVGRHRRIKFSDLQSFLRADEQRRKREADRVTRIGLEAGLDD